MEPDDRAASAAHKRRCAWGRRLTNLGKFRRIEVHGRSIQQFEPKAPGEQIDAGIHRKSAADPPLAGAASAARRAGSRIRPARARANAGGSPAGHEQAGDAAFDQLRECPNTSVATQARRWLWASISTFGRPSRSPSAVTLAASTKRSAGDRRRAPRAGARRRATRSAARGRAGRPACAIPRRGPAADMHKTPGQIRRQQRQSGEQVVIAFFRHGAPDREQHDRMPRIAAVASCGALAGGEKRSRSSP